FLVENLPEYSRSRLQRWIREGRVTVAGRPAAKSGQLLDKPCRIIVEVPAVITADIEPEAIPLDIIFENQDLMAVNKPAGMVVHPSPGHSRHTLVQAALAHAPEIEGVGGVRRPGVVHRLDKDTSGIILLAKNDHAHRYLQRQFQQRSVEKTYLALLDGHPPTPSGRVEAAIGRDPAHRQRMAVTTAGRGREAISEYRILERFPRHSWVEVRPLTGRQHQIRLHMAFLGCPVVGDRVYGYKQPSVPLERHFLHASRLALQLPGEKGRRSFDAPLAPELEGALEILRRE
ncbi:MAG TPA: RluA family pseudouridine synthase, partial [Anaerolineales bacterium]|nr:RluA family pseudouridine synthase [Anaerolineales bacterium]